MSPQRIKAMIEHQVKACEAFLHKTASLAIKLPVPDFVTRVFTLHRRLIERWDGAWYYHTEPVLVEDTSYSIKVAQQCWNSFLRRVEPITEGWRSSFQITDNYDVVLPLSLALSSKVFERKYFNAFGELVFEASAVRRYVVRLGYKRDSEGRQRGDHITAPIRVGQRIAPVALRALRIAGVPKGLLQAWENLFQSLGELAWVGKKVPIACTMSCAPVSFLRLGHYGESSCYKNGGGADYSKLWLAADCPDSFVLLFHQGKEEAVATKKPSPIKVSGRGWGIGMPERGAFVSNFYLLSKEMVRLSVKRAIGEGLGVRNPEWVEMDNLHSIANRFAEYASLYLNDDRQLITQAQSTAKLEMLRYYLRQVIEHATRYGLYSFHGNGPQDVLEWSPNRFPHYRAKMIYDKIPTLWPYKDATTQRLTVDAVNAHGDRLIRR